MHTDGRRPVFNTECVVCILIFGSIFLCHRYKQGNENALDPEEERMGALLRKRIKAGGSVVALRKIKITYNSEESALFEKQNQLLINKALPSYVKLERAINNEGNVFIWFEQTKSTDDFITDIQLSHSDPAHELFRDLSKSGYDALGEISLFSFSLLLNLTHTACREPGIKDGAVVYP